MVTLAKLATNSLLSPYVFVIYIRAYLSKVCIHSVELLEYDILVKKNSSKNE